MGRYQAKHRQREADADGSPEGGSADTRSPLDEYWEQYDPQPSTTAEQAEVPAPRPT